LLLACLQRWLLWLPETNHITRMHLLNNHLKKQKRIVIGWFQILITCMIWIVFIWLNNFPIFMKSIGRGNTKITVKLNHFKKQIKYAHTYRTNYTQAMLSMNQENSLVVNHSSSTGQNGISSINNFNHILWTHLPDTLKVKLHLDLLIQSLMKTSEWLTKFTIAIKHSTSMKKVKHISTLVLLVSAVWKNGLRLESTEWVPSNSLHQLLLVTTDWNGLISKRKLDTGMVIILETKLNHILERLDSPILSIWIHMIGTTLS